MSRNLALLILPLLLTGCIAQSRIQADYMSQESDCRSRAEARGDSSSTKDSATAAYIVGSAFSECMNKNGWKVSVPKPPAGMAPAPVALAPATTPPVSVAPPPGTITRTQAVTDSKLPAAAPILGPGVQPSPAAASVPPINTPRAAAPDPTNMPTIPSTPNGYSTYQPGRPDGVPEPDYGKGAARNFDD